MKPENTEDILELMNGCVFAAVLGAAMELGIFWLLADKPLSAGALAQTLNIPLESLPLLVTDIMQAWLVGG